MIEDDGEMTSETVASTRATSVESETGAVQDRVEQTVRGGEYGAAATVNPSGVTAATPPSPEREGRRDLAQDEEENWEIVKMVGKRRTRKGCEYKVRWKDTWMSDSELRNAARLVREYDALVRGQRGGQRGRPAVVGKNGQSVAIPKCS